MTLDHITPAFRLKLFRAACRINPDHAEDIVQEALIHLWHDSTEPDNLNAYTVHVLKLRGSNYMQAERAKIARLSRQTKPTDNAPDLTPSIERRLLAREQLRKIRANASPKMRQILDHLAAGDDCPTIAHTLQMSPASVRQAVSRFRATIR